jgi:hypothetical protein
MDRSTSESAHARVDAHEGICAERYGNINQQLVMLRGQIASQATDFHARFNTLSNRMWAAACGLIVLSLTGLASVVVILLTRH